MSTPDMNPNLTRGVFNQSQLDALKSQGMINNEDLQEYNAGGGDNPLFNFEENQGGVGTYDPEKYGDLFSGKNPNSSIFYSYNQTYGDFADQVANDPTVVKVDKKFQPQKLPNSGAYADRNENRSTNNYRENSDFMMPGDPTTGYSQRDHLDISAGNQADGSTGRNFRSRAENGYHGHIDGAMADVKDGYAYDKTRAVIHPDMLAAGSHLMTQYGKSLGLSDEDAARFGQAAAMVELPQSAESKFTAAGIQMGDAIKKICLKYNLDDGHLAEYRKEAADDKKAAEVAKGFTGDVKSEDFAKYMKDNGVPADAVTRYLKTANNAEIDKFNAEWHDKNAGRTVTSNFNPSYTTPKAGNDAVREASMHMVDEIRGNAVKISSALDPAVSARYNEKLDQVLNNYQNEMKTHFNDPNFTSNPGWVRGLGSNNIEVMTELLKQSNSPELQGFTGKEREHLANAMANTFLQTYGDTVLAQGGDMKGFTDSFMQKFGITENDLNNANIDVHPYGSTTKNIKGASDIRTQIENYSKNRGQAPGHIFYNTVPTAQDKLDTRNQANLERARAALGENPSPELLAAFNKILGNQQ